MRKVLAMSHIWKQMQTDKAITIILVVGLISTALLRNYHYSKFYSIFNNSRKDNISILREVIGSNFAGPFWIFPYKIKEQTNDRSAQNHKDKFILLYKIFITFWALTILWVIIYFLFTNYFSSS